MGAGYNIIKERWSTFFPPDRTSQIDVSLDELIKIEKRTLLPAPYFFVFFDFECSDLLYSSPEVKKILGLERDVVTKSQESIFELILEDEKPAVVDQSLIILNNFFSKGRKEFNNRVFIQEYRVQTLWGDVINILHQNEVVAFSENDFPKILKARFIDMSWLCKEKMDRVVKLYVYNKKINDIEFYWEQKVDTKSCLQLTPRENEIQEYINHGFTSDQIASELNISVETVKTHRKNIKAKRFDD
ncbi:helix-turn-helix transcriptional regulator [Aliifodinibius sp. S!AR15-10]|uniref:response regulator transcription factor n=1 Tax=Aliifodinibius sp. S!AR15-10 TaxID=2950437 RepID=UPI002862946C|nr:helix-turn-helix transcriptional regulator [Aliifodinibius sp. S!AR15-10]MDR8391981.1 helix-turn-helix transcriptional regulator [Aliifodinibius sp. S!AR15-10]